MAILVTGGAGYIGSHAVLKLQQEHKKVIVLDSVFQQRSPYIQGDFGDSDLIKKIIANHAIDTVMHFGAYIEVGESVAHPQKYYINNVIKTMALIHTLLACGVKKFIFSSSCAVYGEPQSIPITEDHPYAPLSPYGNTKFMIEKILQDYARVYDFTYVALRYFNAAGATPEHNLGERHVPETHIIPIAIQAALTQKSFTIFGTDHQTPDGTCIRDYLHVQDIANAHYQAYQYLNTSNIPLVCNLGTGTGYSVNAILDMIEEVTHMPITRIIAKKRAGDPAILVADANYARTKLHWSPNASDLRNIITSAYEFTYRNTFYTSYPNHKDNHHCDQQEARQ